MTETCKNWGHLYRDRVLGGRVVRRCAHCGTLARAESGR